MDIYMPTPWPGILGLIIHCSVSRVSLHDYFLDLKFKAPS